MSEGGTIVTDRDAFAERARSLEEEYFHRKEREVIDKMRVRAAAEEQRRRLGEKAGVADEEVLSDLQELGYTPETVMLLHLVPLIQTAWAEGGVSEKERDLIVKAARSRGITEGTPCDQQLNMWLATRPSDEMFEKSLRAIRTILQAQPAGRPRSAAKKICCRWRPRSPPPPAASSDSMRSPRKNVRFSRTSATS